MNSLKTDILTTIAYYDALNFPLTGPEIFKYLIKTSPKLEQTSFFNILNALNELREEKKLDSLNGFYFPPNNWENAGQRIHRNKASEKKWKRIKKLAVLIRLIPFVEAAFVTGSLAISNADEKSDLDILIVTKKNRRWTCRFFTMIALTAAGIRRYANKVKNRVCHNVIISQDGSIERQCLGLSQEIIAAVPLITKSATGYNLGGWNNRYLRNAEHPMNNKRRHLHTKKTPTYALWVQLIYYLILGGWIGDRIERGLAGIQKKMITNHVKQLGNQPTIGEKSIIITPISFEINLIGRLLNSVKKIGDLSSIQFVEKMWTNTLDLKHQSVIEYK